MAFLWYKRKLCLFILFFGAKKTSLSLFSLAQRKETKETSTPTRPSPIWEGSTAPTRRSFTKVSSPHQRGGLIFCRLTPVPLRWCPCIVALVSVVLCWCSSAGVLALNLMDFCSLLPIIIVMIYSESETLILDAAE